MISVAFAVAQLAVWDKYFTIRYTVERQLCDITDGHHDAGQY